MTPAGYAIAGLSIALALSLAGTAYVGNEYLEKRDEVRDLTADRNQQKGAAEACTASVDGIKKAADAQTAVAKAAIAAAKASAAAHYAAADEILSTPAAVPGDDCKSAQKRADAWLSRRVKK